LPILYREKKIVNHQFPTVTALNDPPTIYEGMLRCEQGEVRELADKNVWPFTEYVNWHRFRLELPKEYPLKPPVATWLTEISHPNIVPNIPGAVCVSILGENWRPDLRLVSVINALYYLLADPNPNNVFKHSKCFQAAQVCRFYGFPKRGGEKKLALPSDVARFNIIPIPKGAESREEVKLTEAASPALKGVEEDVVRFKILGQREKEAK
jgi:hypothetical protein